MIMLYRKSVFCICIVIYLFQSIRRLWSGEKLCNAVEQLIGPDIGGHPVWNLRTKVPQDEASTVPWHQGKGVYCTSINIAYFILVSGHGFFLVSGHGFILVSGHGFILVSVHGSLLVSGHGFILVFGHGFKFVLLAWFHSNFWA